TSEGGSPGDDQLEDHPSQECAWLRQALDDLDPAPYLSVTDFLWLAEQPFPHSSSG
ncbi:MAG: hypothetical protein JWQ75_2174, partial [Pseudarthrobacter sp.]|nr:hypothetical protein [Pseudarthrobacter sp.]